jgi:F-type H+-transporting ATPase subunit epsilon
LRLEIITPDRKLYEGEIQAIRVPGSKGSFTVLKNHAPLISTLEGGMIKITNVRKGIDEIQVKGGIIEVKRNHVIVLADVV